MYDYVDAETRKRERERMGGKLIRSEKRKERRIMKDWKRRDLEGS